MSVDQFGNQVESRQRPVTLASLIDRAIKAEDMFREGVPIRLLPRFLFVAFLLIIYIANTHWSNNTVRRIKQAKDQVEDLRVDYTTSKAAYMYDSKQSEVARHVKAMNLEESAVPPRKLSLAKD